MKFIIPTSQSKIGTLWGITKLILLVCMFFWFGWKVGVLAALLGINIEK